MAEELTPAHIRNKGGMQNPNEGDFTQRDQLSHWVRVSWARAASSLKTGTQAASVDSEVRSTAALSEDLGFGPHNPHGAHNHLELQSRAPDALFWPQWVPCI